MALFQILATGLGVGQAFAQIQQGKAQEIEMERQAEQERVSAEGRELQRREQLNKVLAQSIVGQAQSGIAGEGTPQSIAIASAENIALSEGLEGLSSRLKQAQLRRQGKAARRAANIQAASTLLQTATRAGQLSG